MSNANTLVPDNIKSLVLASLVKDEERKRASSNTLAGSYNFDFTVRVRGALSKGEDFEKKIPAKADAWGLLALAFSKLNGQTIESLVNEWVAFSPKNADEIKKQAEEAISKIVADTSTVCNGVVKVVSTIEVVSNPDTSNV